MKKVLTPLALALMVALALFWNERSISDAQGTPPAKTTAPAMSAEAILISETRGTMAQLDKAILSVDVIEGATYGEVIEKICLAANVQIGSTLDLHSEWGNEPFESVGQLNGRARDLLRYFESSTGVHVTIVGTTLWFTEGGDRDFMIMRSYETADIQEFLNKRHDMLRKLDSETKAKAEKTSEEGSSQEEDERALGEDFLRDALSAVISAYDYDYSTVKAFGGAISVRSNPQQHVQIEDYLAELRKTLNLR